MKKEYDFSNAKQGKFYVPMDEIRLPVYFDKDIETFLVQKAQKDGKSSLQAIVNELLRKDIEIAQRSGIRPLTSAFYDGDGLI